MSEPSYFPPTKISEIYDALCTLIQEKLPDHKELPNPYEIDLGDDLNFKAGWGLAFSNSRNLNNQICSELSVERQFIFTITRKIFAGSSIKETFQQKRREAEKALFEDQLRVIIEFETNNAVKQNDLIAKLPIYESDGGLEFIKAGQHDLIMLRSVFNLEYRQGAIT